MESIVFTRLFVEKLEPPAYLHLEPIILIHGDYHTGQVCPSPPVRAGSTDAPGLRRSGSPSPTADGAGPRTLSTKATAST